MQRVAIMFIQRGGRHTWLPVGDKTVLVITVESPRLGDPIFTLRKEFDKFLSGMVYVRKHGRTDRADAADMDGLQRRLLAAGKAGGAELELTVVGDVPVSWFEGHGVRACLEEWSAGRHRELVARAQAVERRRQGEAAARESDLAGATGIRAVVAQQQAALMSDALRGFLGEEDQRTLDEYTGQVDEWRKRLTEAAATNLPGLYVAQRHGVIALVVRNLGSRFLPDVEIGVRFDFEKAMAAHKRPKIIDLPTPPRDFGKPSPAHPFMSASILNATIPQRLSLPEIEGVGRRTWVEKGSFSIKFKIGDLRQHGSDQSDEIYVLLPERPPDGVLHGSWNATVRDIDGLLTGTVELPVAEAPTDLPGLLNMPA